MVTATLKHGLVLISLFGLCACGTDAFAPVMGAMQMCDESGKPGRDAWNRGKDPRPPLPEDEAMAKLARSGERTCKMFPGPADEKNYENMGKYEFTGDYKCEERQLFVECEL